ncbi:GNAT family N-acetyltransferase [Aurantiacibacter poecillastricola]|uniref:GNAT family N-acetyltransferase n=1 Tax=Aurantiacibacter poecillastricola TaxID=3064385 RepID=UPI0027402A02|nr:GNAT family N-acetyltransferase [Aurantiacibacter sp. 219JJ12-13]MDP5261540.1 GNAT family N-acetyltransferase [Aurantiacibacter sp. 219JJ12-13]
MTDALDAIMAVMEDAFDPRYGEAWTRRQVADSLTLRNVYFTLLGPDGAENFDPAMTAGFALTRQVLDEEEILLIAIRPSFRGLGLGKKLLGEVIARASGRSVTRIFLEMREGNPAEHLYARFGFEMIGRRNGYYRGAIDGPIDAITFSKTINTDN